MKILLCGATGSIGTQLLEVLEPNQKIVGIYYNNNHKLAKQIIKKFNIKYFLSNSDKANSNVKNIEELIKKTKPDIIVNAITGWSGIYVTISAIQNKIDLALANKESLVVAGKFITELLVKNKVNIYPIDSEHSSLFQLIKNNDLNHIKELIITCSGSVTYFKKNSELEKLTFNDVIKHPNWNMGYKISVDSATLINKCFEIVEAYWLFGTNKIKSVVHKESIVHAIVKYNDGSYFMNASYPDMKLPIKLAINKYKDVNLNIPSINFDNLNLTFNEIDLKKWKPIDWAYLIINDKNNVLGTIINASNEIAIELFKDKKIKFAEIIPFIEWYINKYKNKKLKNFDDIFYLLDKIISSDYEQVIQDIRCNKNSK